MIKTLWLIKPYLGKVFSKVWSSIDSIEMLLSFLKMIACFNKKSHHLKILYKWSIMIIYIAKSKIFLYSRYVSVLTCSKWLKNWNIRANQSHHIISVLILSIWSIYDYFYSSTWICEVLLFWFLLSFRLRLRKRCYDWLGSIWHYTSTFRGSP
jgi:hypothetical protein